MTTQHGSPMSLRTVDSARVPITQSKKVNLKEDDKGRDCIMAEVQDDEEDEKELHDARRPKAPSKKKFEEDMEVLGSNIRAKEQELEASKVAGMPNAADQLKNLKVEKNASIEQRKKIDVDLQKLNKDISEMMCNLSRLESTLHYRNEDKINEAIKRLEWNMSVQNFKLSEEKKIVAEIDSLRRSKKTLALYLSLKKEMERMRDRQRLMREERDHCFHNVTQLKQQEEKVRSDAVKKKAQTEKLKKEVDSLYEAKRQMIATYKKQREEFNDMREKQRHESFKKREEEKRAIQARLKKELEDLEAQKRPYEDEICLCNTLIHYLNRFVANTDVETVSPTLVCSPATEEPAPLNNQASGLAEELEDGQYVLLRKCEDNSYVSCSAKHSARKQRRSRKASMVKRITHTPEVLSQFLALNLNAPTTMAEVLASLEQLRARRLHYEREAEAKSETESAVYEMSRQASHTESCDGQSEVLLSDQVMEELLQVNGCWQAAETVCSLKQEDTSRPGWVNNHEEPDILKNYSCAGEEVTLDKRSFPSLLETVADSFKSSRGSLFKRPTSMFVGEETDSFNGVTEVVHQHHPGSSDCAAVATSFSKAAWDTTPQGFPFEQGISVSLVNGVSKCNDVQELGNGCPTVQWQEVAQGSSSDKGSTCHGEDAAILTENESNSGGINGSQMAEHVFCNNSETYCTIPIATMLDGAEVSSELGNESELCVAISSLHLKGDSMVRKDANFTDRGNKNKDGGILI